ncbi:MAG: AmmeMemoRadiSam system radical SAM enzyme [bacterium]
MKEAILYDKLPEGKVQCHLCAHECTIKNGKRGICFVRENRDGTLYSLVYGKLVSMNIDPIEKKPLFHFLPASKSLSIATVGCNFMCRHCQNNEISQYPREHGGDILGSDASPDAVVAAAEQHGCASISYTYTEPTIFMEFASDCAKLAREKGIKNVFVSNGFMTPESADYIIPYLDGNNIDLKGDETFYSKICGAHLEPIKETIRRMRKGGVWVEITTLVIPGHNDSTEVLTMIAEFIRSVDPNMPWHVTQFYPTFKLLDQPRTPLETLKRAREIGFKAGLSFVYEGNVPGEAGENTYCPRCKSLLIERMGYSIRKNNLTDGACRSCGLEISGVWK